MDINLIIGLIKDILALVREIIPELVPLALAYLAYRQWALSRGQSAITQAVEKIEVHTNSLVEKLVTAEKKDSRAEGRAEGVTAGKAEGAKPAEINVEGSAEIKIEGPTAITKAGSKVDDVLMEQIRAMTIKKPEPESKGSIQDKIEDKIEEKVEEKVEEKINDLKVDGKEG